MEMRLLEGGFFCVWCFYKVSGAIIGILLQTLGDGGDSEWVTGRVPLWSTLACARMAKSQDIDQCVCAFFFFHISPECTHCNFAYLWDKISLLAATMQHFPPWDLQAYFALKRLFHYGTIHGRGSSLCYWCSSLAFCAVQWDLLIDYAKQPMMWQRRMADMLKYGLQMEIKLLRLHTQTCRGTHIQNMAA